MWSKGNDVISPMEKCPMDFYQELFLLSEFDKSSPSVTQDQEICHKRDYEVMTSLPPEAEFLVEPFKWGLLVVQIWYL